MNAAQNPQDGAQNIASASPVKAQTKKQRRADTREYLQLGSLAMAVGIIVGLASIAFRGLLSLTHNFFFLGEVSFRYNAYQHEYFAYGWLVFLIPAIGGLIVGLIIKYGASEVKGHGVPEVMYAVMKNKGRIKAKVGIIKAFASAITIGSGGSAGREGPMVQIGASGGSAIGQFLGLSDEKLRTLVGCGTAAGIAATFNAPIAGVVFALELILLEFKTKSFVPLVVSSVSATVISHLFIGEELAYPIYGIAEIYILRSPYELLLYLLLGLLAGVMALFFIKFFYRIEEFFQSIKIQDFVKPMIGGLLVGVIGLVTFDVFGHYFIFGTGYGSIMPALLSENVSGDLMYAGAKLALFMLLLMFLKMLATSLTLGSGGSGGLFAPSLWIGGMMGAGFGVFVNLAFPGIAAPFGAYALVGMAAFFAGTSRAVLTSIIILFEMTSTYEIILPLMFACVVATAVSKVMSRGTLYTYGMERMGIRYSYDREVNVLETTEVSALMTRNVEVVTENMTLDEVIAKVLTTGHRGFPCVSADGRLCGIITNSDIEAAIRKNLDRQSRVCSLVKLCQPETAYPDDYLQDVLERMAEKDFGYIPVVDRGDSRRLVGIITRKDIIQVYQMRSKDKKDKEDYWK